MGKNWAKRHGRVLICLLAIPLLLVPLALTACGSSEAETERPKSPYELESMIESVQADVQDVKGSLESIQGTLSFLQQQTGKDWTSDISAIRARLDTIETQLANIHNPTPTAVPTNPSGWPYPTQPPSQGGLTVTVLDKPAVIAQSGWYDFAVRLENQMGHHAVAELIMWLTAYSSDTEVQSSSTSTNISSYTTYCFPTETDCNQIRIVMPNIPIASGTSQVLYLRLTLSQTSTSFEWIPSFTISE